MMTAGMIAWVLFLLGLLCLLHPSREMRRDPAGNGVYYSLWAILFGSAIFLHYRYLAQSGYARFALVSDAIGIGIYAVGALMWLAVRLYGRAHDPLDDEHASSQFLHTRRR